MTDKPKVTFAWSNSYVNGREADSEILEVDINNESFAALYFQDNSWKIIIGTHDSKAIHIEWADFLEVIDRLHKHVAVETEIMIGELKKPKQDDDKDTDE